MYTGWLIFCRDSIGGVMGASKRLAFTGTDYDWSSLAEVFQGVSSTLLA